MVNPKNRTRKRVRRDRARPLKNVRERRRRADLKSKFMQLHNLCCSKKITSIAPKLNSPEATGLQIPIAHTHSHADHYGGVHTVANQEPSKVGILAQAIQTFQTLDKKLQVCV